MSVQILQGNCLDQKEWLNANVLITDPPYGIQYKSGSRRNKLANSIQGDNDTSLRDQVLQMWGNRPAIVFGSWKRQRPESTKMLLVWDTKGALGMGDLSLPWKPSHQEIYVIGRGFIGKRTSDVIRCAPVQSMAYQGRTHPHEKPVTLMEMLLLKCPSDWIVADPFAGTGSTLIAAKLLGRSAIGIEIDPNYVAIAKSRLSQEMLLTPNTYN